MSSLDDLHASLPIRGLGKPLFYFDEVGSTNDVALEEARQGVAHGALVIADDQTGYMKGRYIGTNVRIIQDIIDYAEEHQIGGAILMLDFRKAFDSVEHNFISKVLSFFGFGGNFLKWVNILYNGAYMNIKNNGWIGGKDEIERGTRQGCPVSGLIFLTVVEILAEKIRKKPLDVIRVCTYNINVKNQVGIEGGIH